MGRKKPTNIAVSRLKVKITSLVCCYQKSRSLHWFAAIKSQDHFIGLQLSCIDTYAQALEFRTPLFPRLAPPAIMVWIFIWKYIFEPFIHILQHFVLQLSRSTNLFLGSAAVLLK